MTLRNAFGELNLETTQQEILSAVSYSEFSRIEDKRYKDSEEIRFDIPTLLPNNSVYVGVAPDGTSTTSASWTVIRTYFNISGNPFRKRIRFGVAWDSRTDGWSA